MSNIQKGDWVVIEGNEEEIRYKGCMFKVLSDPYIAGGHELVEMRCYDFEECFEEGYATEFLRKVAPPTRCNMCGKQFDMWDTQGNFGFSYRIGYGSRYDFNDIKLNMCCDCFDKVLDYILPQCKIDPLTEYD